MNYVLLSVAVVVLSALYDKIKKDKSFARIVMIIICLLLAWFAGSRTRYNDTVTYINGFLHTSNDISSIFSGPFSVSKVYLFNLWQFLIFNLISQNEHVFLFLCSLVFVIPSVRLICKYSESIPFSMFLFVWCGMYLFSLAGLKQAMAIGLFLMAIPSLIEKKYVKYYLYNLLAIGFHAYSIVLLILPLLGRELFNKKTFWFSVAIVVLGVGLSYFSSIISSILEFFGKDVKEETIITGSVNIYRALVYLVPIVLMIFGKRKLSEDVRESDKIFLKTALLSGFFMFLSLFGNPILFGRIPQYFIVGIVVELPYLIKIVFNKRDAKIVSIVALLLFSIYGFYGLYVDNVFAKDVFKLVYWWF